MRRLLGAALAALILAGCAGLLRAPALDVAPVAALPDGVTSRVGVIASGTGCAIDYRLYRPVQPVTGTLVVLGHGFLRSQARMRDLALALAADGIPVATLDLCNMQPWSGSHAQNAADMMALARHLAAPVAAGGVVYAGFSAGALAALVAARNDPAARGVVALDLVDAGGIGWRAARGLKVPLLGLSGEPTNCNARDNGRVVFAANPATRVERVAGAGHCAFESPTDRLCELVCDDPDPTATAANRARIIAATTALVRSLVAPPPDGQANAALGGLFGSRGRGDG